jgi:hypothetical protein
MAEVLGKGVLEGLLLIVPVFRADPGPKRLFAVLHGDITASRA